MMEGKEREQTMGLTREEKLKWGIVVFVVAVFWLLPVGEIYTHSVKLFMMITMGAILVVAFELMDVIIPSVLMMFAYALAGIATTEVSFAGMTTSATYITLGCLVLVAALEESGLLTRVSCWIMIRAGGSFRGIVWGLFAASLITCFMTMGNSFALMAAFGVGCVAAMKIEGTKTASAIGLVICLGAISTRCFVYSPMMLAVQIAQSQVALGSDFSLTFSGLLLHNWPVIIPILLVVLIILRTCKPEQELMGKEYFSRTYEELGAVTSKEKKAAAVLAVIVVWSLFSNFIPLSSDYAIILVPWLMFFPGIGVASAQSIKRVNFSIVFFVAGCYSIGNVATGLGLGQLIADTLMPVISQFGPVTLLATIFFLTVVLNFLMTPYAIAACLTVPLIALAASMEVDPLAVNYIIMHGSDAIILPYEFTPYLVVFGLGMIQMRDFMKFMAIKLVIGAVFLFAVLVPYWKLFGLY